MLTLAPATINPFAKSTSRDFLCRVAGVPACGGRLRLLLRVEGAVFRVSSWAVRWVRVKGRTALNAGAITVQRLLHYLTRHERS